MISIRYVHVSYKLQGRRLSGLDSAVTCLGIGRRLGLKYEPAGKVRPFAMVDTIRLCLDRPVHDWLMEILRSIPHPGWDYGLAVTYLP